MGTYESESTISLWDAERRRGITLKNIKSGKRYTFTVKRSLVVGRVKPFCDLQITTDDLYMSAKHLRFINEANGIYIEDLHSTNGTKINGRPVVSKVKIKQGDILRMGKSEFEVIV